MTTSSWKLNNIGENMKKLFLALLSISAIANNASADRLSDMVSPVTNPVNFEDPRTQTEARPIYIYHKLGEDFVTQGGDIRGYALQLRYAVNERLGITAHKDGYVDFNPDAVLNDDEGFANLAAGVKYAFYRDAESGQILTAGLRYEVPTGDNEVFHGRGSGVISPFLSGAMNMGGFNLMGYTSVRQALDNSDSSFYDFSLHADYPIGSFYPTMEVNVFHVIDAGNRLGIADEGQDFFNFGSSNSDGITMVTMGLGGRYKISDKITYGLAYEFPLTNGEGSNVTDWRVTSDFTIGFNL